jgi:hypothetical protein
MPKVGEGAIVNQPEMLYKNRILSGLPKAEIARLAPHLSPVVLKSKTQLVNGHAEYAYFMEEGLASVVLTLTDGATVEVGVIGIDGVVGISALLGAGPIPGQTFIQVAGSGLRIDAHILKEEFDRGGQLREHVQRYMMAYLVSISQGAACNRTTASARRSAVQALPE